MRTIFCLFFVFVVCRVEAQDEYIFCSQAFCDELLKDSSCVSLPKNCEIQNATHNGLFLPFPGPCNCCDYCLSNIGENQECSVGSPSSPTPTSICGDGLACSENNVCEKIRTPCTLKKDAYDEKKQNGLLGHLEFRPICNRNGEYEPFSCIPGEICYCVSEEGDRIFGEIEFSEEAPSILNCQCSRNYHKAVELIGNQLTPGEFFHCASNGDYDELQCIGESCFCADPKDGNPKDSKPRFVDVTSISPETIECFDNELHKNATFFRECETKYISKLQEVQQFEDLGFEVFGIDFPNCQIDGFYAPVQHNLTHKFCADPTGKILENFAVANNDELASTMNCKCARARSIMKSDEKPTCCGNGNYESVQCRRGLCRCVDSDGRQVEKEVDVDSRSDLSCFQKVCTE